VHAFALEVVEQRVIPFVERDDVEVGVGLGHREPTEVVGDVEVEGVAARAGDADVLGSRPPAVAGRP
jgi:hypothetical protein